MQNPPQKELEIKNCLPLNLKMATSFLLGLSKSKPRELGKFKIALAILFEKK